MYNERCDNEVGIQMLGFNKSAVKQAWSTTSNNDGSGKAKE